MQKNYLKKLLLAVSFSLITVALLTIFTISEWKKTHDDSPSTTTQKYLDNINHILTPQQKSQKHKLSHNNYHYDFFDILDNPRKQNTLPELNLPTNPDLLTRYSQKNKNNSANM